MMNYFGSAIYSKKPSGIATYSAGMWGGARCGVGLRAYLGELGCVPVSATFQHAGAWKKGAFDDEGRLDDEGVAAKSAGRTIEQLEWRILRGTRCGWPARTMFRYTSVEAYSMGVRR